MPCSCFAPGMTRVPDRAGGPDVSVSGAEAGSFLLEIVGLAGIALLGWRMGDGGAPGLSLSALFVALAGAVWGIFRTRGFVPNGEDPVIAIPGPLRLALEFTFYAVAATGLWISGWELATFVLILGVIIITVMLRDRTFGLLRGNRNTDATRVRPGDTTLSPPE